MNKSLADLLQAELKAMDQRQVTAWRRELSRELPRFVRETANKARQATTKTAVQPRDDESGHD